MAEKITTRLQRLLREPKGLQMPGGFSPIAAKMCEVGGYESFFLAGSLAGAAALLYALYITNIRYTEGFRVGLIAFTAAVLGGIGNLPGAVLGGLGIGFVESFNNGLGWHAPGSDWTQSLIFAVLILILVFRPEGLLGERTPEGA